MSSGVNKTLSDFKKKLRHSRYFSACYPFLKKPDKKFVIYTRGRTGSTVLTDLLNSHPDMFCDHEIFNISDTITKVKYPLLYISSCSKRASAHNKNVYGFKLKIEQMKNEHEYKDIDVILSRLETAGWKFIYLKRINILNHTISGLLSNQSKVFHLKNGKEFKHEKINIDCKHLFDVMNYFEDLERQEEESLKYVSYMTVNYEPDLLDNSAHQKTADRIFEYLGISSHPVNTTFRKIIPENLKDIILNYEEMHDFVINTRFGKFL